MKLETIELPCGCVIRPADDNQVRWQMGWCPLHAAAGELLTACKYDQEIFGDIVYSIPAGQEAPYSQGLANSTLRKMRVQSVERMEALKPAIAKAEGGA